jgi:pimeloyl-ACP methyl ester carboxylesterase
MTIMVVLVLLLAALIAGLAWFTANTARRVEAALPPRGRFMAIDGERIHYVDTGGAGPAVVMIHGLGGNLLHFDYALAGRVAGEFRLILVDRPGAGYSTRSAGGDASLTAQAAAIAKLIRALGLTRPLVAGHSLGGAISLVLALDHPDCVGGLALFAPLTHAQDEVHAVFRRLLIRSSLVRSLVAWTLATPLGIRNGPAVLKEVFAPEAVVPVFPLRAGGLLGLRPKAFYATSWDLVAINDVLPAYTELPGTLHRHELDGTGTWPRASTRQPWPGHGARSSPWQRRLPARPRARTMPPRMRRNARVLHKTRRPKSCRAAMRKTT